MDVNILESQLNDGRNDESSLKDEILEISTMYPTLLNANSMVRYTKITSVVRKLFINAVNNGNFKIEAVKLFNLKRTTAITICKNQG